MICPTCNGKKIVFSIDGVVKLPCFDCKATGEVDDRHPEWKIAGESLYNARIARRETLRAFCQRTGVDPVLRSNQERGFVDPSGVDP